MSQSVFALTTALAGLGLTWLVQSSALLVLGLVAGRLLRRSGPAVQSAAYRTTLVAVLVCPIASGLLAAAGYEGLMIRLPQPAPDVAAPPAPVVAEPRPAPVPELAAGPPALPVFEVEPVGPRTTPVAPALVEPSPAVEPVANSPIPWARIAPAIALLIWLIGSAVLAVRLLVGHRRMARLRAGAVPAGADAESLCGELAAVLEVSPPEVLRSPFLPSPCLDGMRRPAILIPEGDDAGLRETFAHELAHLSRHDALWNLLRRVAAAAGWVQPLLWILSRRIEAAAEEVCDDVVVHLGADRAHYAGHLLELAGRSLPPVAPAGVGMISLRTMLARRVVRILDDTRSLSIRVGTLAVAVMLVIGLCGTLLAGMLGVGGRGEGTAPPIELAADPAVEPGQDQAAGTHNDSPVKNVADPKPAPASIPITGRIVDTEGRPVAGVSVRVNNWSVAKGGDLTPWLDAVRRGEPSWTAGKYTEADRERARATREATTDSEGRFRLETAGPGRVAEIIIQGPTVAQAELQVANRKMDPLPAPGFINRYGPGTPRIYGADFTFVAAPMRPIEGVVKDAKTGQPLRGAEVRSYLFAGAAIRSVQTAKAMTDGQGHFRLLGMPRGKGNEVLIVPTEDQPYFTQRIDVPDPSGKEPVSVDVALARGVWIEGSITEKETRRPVVDATLYYFPFLDNVHAKAHPAFHGGGASAEQHRFRTGPDGRFRLVGLPGRAIIGAEAPNKAYLQGFGSDAISGLDEQNRFRTYSSPITPSRIWPTTMAEIDPPADAETMALDLQVVTGPSVRLRLVDEDGRAVSGVSSRGLTGRDSHEQRGATRADCEVANMMAGEVRTVLLQHEGRRIGKVAKLREKDDVKGPVVVTLEPLASITGRVLGPDGNPAPGATVEPMVLPQEDFAVRLPQVATDERGRFVLNDVPAGAEYQLAVSIDHGKSAQKTAFWHASVRPGLVIDVKDLRFEPEPAPPIRRTSAKVEAPAEKPATATLPITGRVVDLEGRPVAGASIEVGEVQVPKSGSLTAWLDGVKTGQDGWVIAEQIDRKAKEAEPFKGKKASTDADGRFRIEGLKPERVVGLTIRGEMIATTKIDVATRKMEPLPAPGFPNQYGPGSMTIYGAEFTYTAAPSRPIVGMITDRATGKALAGVGVQSDRFAGSDFVRTRTERTETDADGRFRLNGMPAGKGNGILIVPNDDQPYLVQGVKVPDAAGAGPVTVDLALPAGVWIEGTLTEKGTGKPVAGAQLHYMPFLANTFAQAHPSFEPDANSTNSAIQDRYRTRADGSFRLVGLPGRAVVGAMVARGPYRQGVGAEAITGMNERGLFETYHSPVPPGKLRPTVMKEIDPPAEARTVRVDLQLETGASVRLRLVDAEGKPVTGVSTMALKRRDSHEADVTTSAEIAAESLIPGEERTVLLRHLNRRLGKAVRVREGDDAKGPVVVTLEPLATMTGAVADEEGNPSKGATVRTDPLPGGSFSLSLTRVATDERGRFVVPNVPAGCEYSIAVESPGPLAKMRFAFVRKAVVRPGETTDVGVVRFGGSAEQASLPASEKPATVAPAAAASAKPASASLPITGRVVDLEGRPVAGASIEVNEVRVPKSGSLTGWLDGVKKGQPPWIAAEQIDWKAKETDLFKGRKATADADGRFRIEGLNAERVVDLTIRGANIATARIEVATRKIDPLPAAGFPNQYGPGTMTIYGAEFVYTAAPGRPIVGLITDKATGKPLAGVGVRSDGFAGSDFVGTMVERTETDASGRFRLNGMPRGKGNRIVVVPNDDQPYLVQTPKVPDPPGTEPVSVELALPAGVWIEGRLTDKATGKPVVGAWLHYMPFLENRFAQAHPSFHSRGQTENAHIQDRYVTKADGSFRLVGLPGRAIVGAVVHGKAYLQGAGSEAISGLSKDGIFETYGCPVPAGNLFPTVMKEINPAADAKVVRVELQATTGPSVRLRIVDAEGKPVAGVSTMGLKERGSHEVDATVSPEIAAENLIPGEERTVLVRHLGRKIGKAVRVREKDDAKGPVVVTLEPLATMTGVVADADGATVQGATVRTDPQPGGNFSLSLGQVTTDEQGRFVVPDVPVGCEYAMVVESGALLAKRKVAFSKEIVVRPGETKDVGKIQFDKD